MNIFNEFYSTDIDPLERSFLIAEATLEIEIERVNKEYMYESGLINLGCDTIFCETATANRENAFSKFVNGLFSGIRTFFESISEAISGIFDKRQNISLDDVKKSSKIKLTADVDKLDQVTEQEIAKGQKLLKQVSSSPNGVSDGMISSWIKNSESAIKAIAPSVISIGAALGLRTLYKSFFKKKTDKTKEIENEAKQSSKSDSAKQQEQKKTILNQIASLFRMSSEKAKKVASEIDKSLQGEYSEAIKGEDTDATRKIGLIDRAIKDLEARFKKGEIGDDEYLKQLKAENSKYEAIKSEHSSKKAGILAKYIEQTSAKVTYDKIVKQINDKITNGEFTKTLGKSYIAYAASQYMSYKTGKLKFTDYMTNMQLNHITRNA